VNAGSNHSNGAGICILSRELMSTEAPSKGEDRLILRIIPKSPGRGRDKPRDEESHVLLIKFKEGFLTALGMTELQVFPALR
jgi:hypothetical protein